MQCEGKEKKKKEKTLREKEKKTVSRRKE